MEAVPAISDTSAILNNGSAIESDHKLYIAVRDQQGHAIDFRIKPTTQLGKVFQSYCERRTLNPNVVKFLFDGTRVHPSNTAKSLDMQDKDVIDCVIEQIGGA